MAPRLLTLLLLLTLPSGAWAGWRTCIHDKMAEWIERFVLPRAVPEVGKKNINIVPENQGKAVPTVFSMSGDRTLEGFGDPIAYSKIKIGTTLKDARGVEWKVVGFGHQGAVQIQGLKSVKGQNHPVEVTRFVRTRVKPQPAYTYTARVAQNGKAGVHKIQIAIPALPDGNEDQESLKTIEKLISHFPKSQADSVDYIRVNNTRSAHDQLLKKEVTGFDRTGAFARLEPGADGKAGRKTIDFYPSALESPLDDLISLSWHEVGHTTALKLYDSIVPPQEWLDAMAKDAASVSRYAKVDATEDFGETMRVYLESNAGSKSPELREKFSNRFQYLDHLFKVHPNARKEAVDSYLKTAKWAGIGITVTGSAAAGGIKVFLDYRHQVTTYSDLEDGEAPQKQTK